MRDREEREGGRGEGGGGRERPAAANTTASYYPNLSHAFFIRDGGSAEC